MTAEDEGNLRETKHLQQDHIQVQVKFDRRLSLP